MNKKQVKTTVPLFPDGHNETPLNQQHSPDGTQTQNSSIFTFFQLYKPYSYSSTDPQIKSLREEPPLIGSNPAPSSVDKLKMDSTSTLKGLPGCRSVTPQHEHSQINASTFHDFNFRKTDWKNVFKIGHNDSKGQPDRSSSLLGDPISHSAIKLSPDQPYRSPNVVNEALLCLDKDASLSVLQNKDIAPEEIKTRPILKGGNGSRERQQVANRDENFQVPDNVSRTKSEIENLAEVFQSTSLGPSQRTCSKVDPESANDEDKLNAADEQRRICTAHTPFAEFCEEPKEGETGIQKHQAITFQLPYQNLSFEELRLADYVHGHREYIVGRTIASGENSKSNNDRHSSTQLHPRR